MGTQGENHVANLRALYIDGEWIEGGGRVLEPVIDPATEEVVAHVTHATAGDLDRALAAVAREAARWRRTSAFERSKILRKAADILRGRSEMLARLITVEQGKPLHESRGEVAGSADMLDWFAEEGRRAYGRVIPARSHEMTQIAYKVPIGPVAAFCAWNAPLNTPARKVGGALAAGCPIIVKGSEETPGATIEFVRAFEEAGLPAGVLNLVFGDPPMISDHLINAPVIRKVTFTGSVPVGRMLAVKAAAHAKAMTMELGGHSPVLVFADADIDRVADGAVKAKYRNAGQICYSPTRFYVETPVYDAFVEAFTARAAALRVGSGLADGTEMGPMTNARRIAAMRDLVGDAEARGATVRTGGKRRGNSGYFWEPTVVTDVPLDADIVNKEPFGPVAILDRFSSAEEGIRLANRLPYGLAAYLFTDSAAVTRTVTEELETGTLAINNFQITVPETPFGGVKDSGLGREGGAEGLDSFLVTKFVSQS